MEKIKEGMRLIEAKEKFGNENVEKIFELQIDHKMFDVYLIKCGGTETRWIDYLERGLLPYTGRTHKICWGVICEQLNRPQNIFDANDFSGRTFCSITANGKKIYEFKHHSIGGYAISLNPLYELNDALKKAQDIIDKIQDHPFDFINPKKEIGRKIWYYGLPATIKLTDDFGIVNIVPDLSYLSLEEWFDELIKRTTRAEEKNTLLGKSPFSVYKGNRCSEIRGVNILTEAVIDWNVEKQIKYEK